MLSKITVAVQKVTKMHTDTLFYVLILLRINITVELSGMAPKQEINIIVQNRTLDYVKNFFLGKIIFK